MCLPPIQPIGWCSTDHGGPTTSVSAPRYAIGFRPLRVRPTGEVGWSLGEKLFLGLGSWEEAPQGCRRMRMAVYASAQTSSQNQAANSPATGWPGITGTVRVGETLTATTDRIEDEDGLTDVVFAYRWIPPGSGDKHRRGHRGSDKLHLYRDQRRRGQGHQGAGHLRRRRGQRRVADQRRKAVRPTLGHPR